MILHEIETLAKAEMEEIQLARLQSTVRNVYEKVSFYRDKFDQAAIRPEDIKTLADLKRLPFTKKADLRAQYPFGLMAVDQKDIVRIHASSGTSGKPTVVCYTKKDIDMWADLVARSISTAGGIRWDQLDARLMLSRRPGVFAAGEMLDWEAPTGGYLLTACFASGRRAGRGALDWLARKAEAEQAGDQAEQPDARA